MEPVNNVGMTNYATQLPQTQQQYYDDYSSMPMVYDPAVEEKKASASSGKGLMALGALALAGVALYGGFKWGKSKAVKDVIKDAPEELAKVKEELAKVKEECATLQKRNDEAYEIADKKTFWNPGLKKRRERIKEALRPKETNAGNKAEGAAKKADDAAAKTEETAAKADDAAAKADDAKD